MMKRVSMTGGLLRVPGVALLAVGVLALAGCAGNVRPVPRGNVVTPRPAAVSVDGYTDWAWSISGDRAIRPLQVFSLGGKTYLQMRAGQRIPAILVNTKPVPFVLSPPYLVVQGVPQRMDLVANGFRAVVVHRGPVAMPAAARVTWAPERSAPTSYNVTPTLGQVVARRRGPRTRTVRHRAIDLRGVLPKAKAAARVSRRVWTLNEKERVLSRAVADWAARAGYELVWRSHVDRPIEQSAEYRAPAFLSALDQVLADASTANYRYLYSVGGGRTVTVISVKQS